MSETRKAVGQYCPDRNTCLTKAKSVSYGYASKDGYSELVFSSEDFPVFETGEDYYLCVSLKRDALSDVDIDLTLRRAETNGFDDNLSYQLLSEEKLEQKKESDSERVRQIIMYDFKVGSGYSDPFVTFYCESKESANEGDVYSVGGEYYIKRSGEDNDTIITGRKTVQYVTLFSEESDNSGTASFDLTFRPLVENFDRICAEIGRSSIDEQVVNSDGTKGRKLEPVSQELYVINNLVEDMRQKATSPLSSITQLGVWGRPGLLMCINGEPVRVGPSGHYEQNAVTITSFGVAPGENDFFTIDYTGPVK